MCSDHDALSCSSFDSGLRKRARSFDINLVFGPAIEKICYICRMVDLDYLIACIFR